MSGASSRRDFLSALGGLAGAGWLEGVAALTGLGALGMGRLPVNGQLTISFPWNLERLDPHDESDAVAAFFGPAVAEPLFARDALGRVYPTLAAELPQRTARGSRVRLRPLVRSSAGRVLRTSDLLWSLSRARRFGAGALLGEAPPPRLDPTDQAWVEFEGFDPAELAEALSSPLTGVVPQTFAPSTPHGTGAFRAQFERGHLELTRNPWAPRGPAFLEGISVHPAPTLADALRAFEAGHVDLGWLGRGLHGPRPETRLVDAGWVGWVVLHSGKSAGRWGAPGAAAQLLSAIDPPKLERFGLGALRRSAQPISYAGPPCQLLAPKESAYLIELGRSLSQSLSTPGHEITIEAVAHEQLQKRKGSGDFCFALDIARAAGRTPRFIQLSLLHAADPALSRRAPKLAEGTSEHALIERTTATLNLGVVGTLRVVVGSLPNVLRLENWELGDVYRLAPQKA